MRFRVAVLSLTMFIALTASAAVKKEEYGSAKDAEALVSRAVAHAKKVGPANAFKDFTSRAPGWTDRDLYVFAVNAEGICVSHGQNPKLVDKNVLDLRDADGRPFIKDMLDQTRAKPSAWVSYTWNDPVTRKLLAKSTYCERYGEHIYCVGIYKR